MNHGLIGTWRLVSWQVIVDGRPHDLFGLKPRGFLILTPGGRLMVLTTAQDRVAGETDSARAALHQSMLAYTGEYRVEGDSIITTVDASWNESWNGTEQRRRFRIKGGQLVLETEPGPSLFYPGQTDFRRVTWQRERD